jgi:L-gulonolactone oxidase
MSDRTWSNWSGIETWTPERVVAPVDVAGVQNAILDARRDGLGVRAVGSRHSFTGAAVTDGVQVTMGRMARLVDVDSRSGHVAVEAGMPIYRLNELLAQHGLAMANLGDIDQQTVSGAISTGTHGTGSRLTGLAGQVVELQVVRPDGTVGTYSRDNDRDLFDASLISLGALGILTQVTLQAVPAFELRAVESSVPLVQVLEDLDHWVDGHDHFEFYWFPHSDRTLTKANDRLAPGESGKPLPRWRHLLDDEILSNGIFGATNRIATAAPTFVPTINKVAAWAWSGREYVDSSDRVFVAPRRVRFNESEYAMPRAAVPEVLSELRTWVEKRREPISFPVEVRFAAADDLWLSTAYQRESGYIAVHQYHRMDGRAYFDAFEKMVADHGGRPHWGKLHTLEATRLSQLYPRFAEFQALRDKLDPDRVFANDYTTRVFGR